MEEVTDLGYEKSPRIREIAEELIDDHHPHLKDAKELLEYYVRDDGGGGLDR